MRKILFKQCIRFVAIALVLIATSVSASASWPYCCSYSGWYGGNGYYSNYSQESVPYYAVNPPVYYSYPVARTYGLYPFPYSAEVATATCPAVAPEPKLVINRFVEQKLTADSNSFERQPLRITNPFVAQSKESNPVKKASWENSTSVTPKVIYPISLTATK